MDSEPVETAWNADMLSWIENDPGDVRIALDRGMDYVAYYLKGELPSLIALANHALPDSDPGKITRERIRDMRETAYLFQGELRRVYGPESNWGNVPETLTAMAQRVIDHADALERLLPPE